MQKTHGSGVSANYRKAMSCPESRAELVQLAIALEAARKAGRKKTDSQKKEKWRLRKEREMQEARIKVERERSTLTVMSASVRLIPH